MQILREDPPALEKLVPGIPARLVAAVNRALAKEPGDRFPNAGEFGKELQIIRRSIQASASESHGLDETRFANSAEMAALHQQAGKGCGGKACRDPVHAASSQVGHPGDRSGGAARRRGGANSQDGWDASRRIADQHRPCAAAPAAVSAGAAVSADPVLRVESVPAGADIALNGKPTGEVTPAPVTFAGDGPHTLKLTRRSDVSQEVSITAADLKGTALSYTLAAVEVVNVPVQITSAYPVEVMSGRNTLASAGLSHSLSVPSGTRMRVVAREYLLDVPLVASGRTVSFTSPALGKLTVLTKFETCKVKIGERMLGFPPITRMPIVAGRYRVDIVCDSGNNHRACS